MKRLNVILGKKQLVAAGLTVLLGTAVAVNFIYSGGKDKKLTEPAAEVSGTTYGEADLVSVDKSGEAADSSAYFAQARLDKQSSREEAAEVLQSMYQGGDLTKDELAAVEVDAMKMGGYIRVYLVNLRREIFSPIAAVASAISTATVLPLSA